MLVKNCVRAWSGSQTSFIQPGVLTSKTNVYRLYTTNPYTFQGFGWTSILYPKSIPMPSHSFAYRLRQNSARFPMTSLARALRPERSSPGRSAYSTRGTRHHLLVINPSSVISLVEVYVSNGYSWQTLWAAQAYLLTTVGVCSSV